MTVRQLLVRLVPGIFADPNRVRRCKNCRQPVSVRHPSWGWICSEECATEWSAHTTG